MSRGAWAKLPLALCLFAAGLLLTLAPGEDPLAYIFGALSGVVLFDFYLDCEGKK